LTGESKSADAGGVRHRSTRGKPPPPSQALRRHRTPVEGLARMTDDTLSSRLGEAPRGQRAPERVNRHAGCGRQTPSGPGYPSREARTTLDKAVVHRAERRLPVTAMTDKSLAPKSHTIRYIIVLDIDIPSDQDAADLISDQQRRALRRCDQGFSTYLSTATVSISKIPLLHDVLRFGLEDQLQK
jgi:hypothetical protein